jgi:hypothetical protein
MRGLGGVVGPERAERGVRRGRAAVAALAVASVTLASVAVTGCTGFALPPKKKPHPTYASNPAAVRIADAPALLVQCAIRTAGLRPGGQSWLNGLNVHIDSTNAIDFQNWFRTHDAPGPYPETFVIDGHRTHYLAFGAHWVRNGDMWVPAHTARNSPQAQRTSLYAWSLWAAAQDRLPAPVCGTSVTAAGLQAQVYGPSGNPW